MRKTSAVKAQKARNYILFGLVVNYPRPFIISRQNAKIRALGLSYPIFLKVLDELSLSGLLTIQDGNYFKSSSNKRRTGCLLITGPGFNEKKIANELTWYDDFKKSFPNTREIIDTKAIKFDIKTYDTFIGLLNDLNRKHEFVAGGKVLNTESYRLRLSGDDHRIYSKQGYQFLKKGLRRNMTIDGEKTSEVDIQNCHLRILYGILSESGKIPSVSNFEVDDYRFTRDQIKSSFHICLNAENAKKAAQALAKKHKLKYVRALDLIKFTMDYFVEYNEFFFADAWKIPIKREAEICDMVISECIKAGAPVLPIYDSFILKKKHINIVVDKLNELGFEAQVI